jgi:hypothetical protein
MSPAKVLIVEDEAIAALALEKILKKLGYMVCAKTPTGEEAIEVSEGCDPDVVIMDIRLAGKLDGIDAALRIKENRRDVAVIFVSAFSDEPTRERAKAANPLAFISKPLDVRLLERTLEGAFPSTSN